MSTEKQRVVVYYDFASSICYIGHRVMQRLSPDLETLGIDLDWIPLDVAGLLNWRRGAKMDAGRLARVADISKELGVPVRSPSTWLDSRDALAAALTIDDPARATTWRERVWTAVYEEGRACDAPGELERLAGDVGLHFAPDALARGHETLERHTRAAAAEMVTGVPTFMLGSWPFGGIQEDDTMRHVLRRYAERRRAQELGEEPDDVPPR